MPTWAVVAFGKDPVGADWDKLPASVGRGGRRALGVYRMAKDHAGTETGERELRELQRKCLPFFHLLK